MDYNYSNVRALVQSCYGPTILVLATNEAADAARLSHLEMADILRLAASQISLTKCKVAWLSSSSSVDVRTGDELNVGKSAAGESNASVQGADIAALHDLLSRSIWSSPDARLDNKKNMSGGVQIALSQDEAVPYAQVPNIVTKADAEAYLKSANDLTPRFTAYRHDFFSAFPLDAYECFKCPVAVILFATPQDPDILKTFNSLLKTAPPEIEDMLVDACKIYMLVCDKAKDTLGQISEQLTRMKAAFGPILCRNLYLNSSDVALNDTAKQWFPYLSLSRRVQVSYDIYVNGKSPPIGCKMTDGDIIGVKILFEDLARTVIIPSMERRLRDLNALIAERKKGYKKWKMFLMRSSTIDMDAEPPSPDSGRSSVDVSWAQTYATRFKYGTPEHQLRLSADIAFMLQDYELANSYYKMATLDFKNEKAFVHQTAAMDMSCVCKFLMTREVDDSALANYTRLTLGTTFAGSIDLATVRCLFLLHAMYCARRQFKEAASLLVRSIKGETDLRTALRWEQAAVCFLRTTPASARKAAFHLVLAGERFACAGHDTHALVCLNLSLQMYENARWPLARDHVRLAIARVYGMLGHLEPSVMWFSRSVKSNSHPAAQQQQILGEFCTLWRTYYGNLAGTSASISRWDQLPLDDGASSVTTLNIYTKALPLPIPCVGHDDIKVKFIDDITVISPCMAMNRTDAGVHVSAALSKCGLSLSSVNLFSSALTSGRLGTPSPVPFSSPRFGGSTPVNGSLPVLPSSSSAVAGEAVFVEVPLTNPLGVTLVVTARLFATCTNNGKYDAPPCTLHLQPLESISAQFSITPSVPCDMKILGLEVQLEEGACGFIMFTPKGRRLNDTTSQRKSVVYSQPTLLDVVVRSAAPFAVTRLMMANNGTQWRSESELLTDEVRSAKFEVDNTGPVELDKVAFIWTPKGSMCMKSKDDDSNDDTYGMAVIEGPIQINGSASIDMVVRGLGGSFTVSMVTVLISSIGVRAFTGQLKIESGHSIDVKCEVMSSSMIDYDYLMRLSMSNKGVGALVRVQELGVISGSMSGKLISLAEPSEVLPGGTLIWYCGLSRGSDGDVRMMAYNKDLEHIGDKWPLSLHKNSKCREAEATAYLMWEGIVGANRILGYSTIPINSQGFLWVNLDAPDELYHDFNAPNNNLCVVPCVATLRNTNRNKAISFIFECLPPAVSVSGKPAVVHEEDETSKTKVTSYRLQYTWLGSVRHVINSLPPSSEIKIQLNAGILMPSVVSVGAFKVTMIETNGAPLTPIKYTIQKIVRVMQTVDVV